MIGIIYGYFVLNLCVGVWVWVCVCVLMISRMDLMKVGVFHLGYTYSHCSWCFILTRVYPHL